MFPGQFTLCLKAIDIEGMRRFYEALGLKVHIDQPTHVLLNNGDVDIALMTFLEEPSLNFRGADVFQIHEQFVTAGLDSQNTPRHYKGAQYNITVDGMNWIRYDPVGNNIFFDTNAGEIGMKGENLALQRILDATLKRLINAGATQTSQRAFRSHIMDRFMPPERGTSTHLGLDTSSLTEPGRYAGDFSLCLSSQDLQAARNFYEVLGLEVENRVVNKRISMTNGDCRIDLIPAISENWLRFSGSDIFRVYQQLSASGLHPEGNLQPYSKEETASFAPGIHWKTQDPDGNTVYFNTAEQALTVTDRTPPLEAVLKRSLRQLKNINVNPEYLTVLGSYIDKI